MTETPANPPASGASATRHLLLLCVAAACLFFLGLGRLPLLEPDEGRNAEVAREMLSSGDWITPHFNSLPYLDKPVFFFWLVALSFRVWGISEWAARFPSAVTALTTMLLTWFLGRRLFGQQAGLRAGIIFGTTPLVIAFSRLVIFDMTLTCLVTLAMVSLWCAEASDTRPVALDVLAFAAMGVASITKGPVGFLLPLLSLVAYHALGRRGRDLKRVHWAWGVAVFLAAALPWFLTVSIRHPDFPRYAFWQESLQRFATGRARRTGSVLYYVPVYLAGLFPWSFFLIAAAWSRVKKWKELTQEANKTVAFLLAWAGVIFVFFSISRSKLPAYFLPAAVPVSILMARAWAEVEWEARRLSLGWLKGGFASLIGAGLAVTTASQLFQWDAERIRMATKVPLSLVPSVRLSLFYTGLIIVALGLVGRNLAARASGGPPGAMGFMLLALTVPVLVVRWIAPLRAYADSVSSRQLARTIRASPDKDLPLYGYYYFRTSLPFYVQRPVHLVTTDGGEMTSSYVVWRVRELRGPMPSAGLTCPAAGSSTRSAFGPFGAILIDGAGLHAWARSQDAPMLVMARNTHVEELARTVGEIDPLWNGWEYSVWKIPGRKP